MTIIVDKKTRVVKGYHYSSHELESFDNEECTGVSLGQVDFETYALCIMSVDDVTESFPVYDFDKHVLGLVELKIKGVNCIKDEATKKWSLKDGETVYEFHVSVDDPVDLLKHFDSIYIKQQDKDSSTVRINGKSSSKVILKDMSVVKIENLKGSEQTFKVKASLSNEDSYWLATYLILE
jgi:hypothetical protein